MNLSAHAYHRILKPSRTIADLAGQDEIDSEAILLASSFRSLDEERIDQEIYRSESEALATTVPCVTPSTRSLQT